MTSFIADTIALVSHKQETVAALLATSRQLINSSVVPVILSSSDDIWKLLCARPFGEENQENFLRLFSTFSDTMQFTQKLKFHHRPEPAFINGILKDLIENKRYFTRTISEFQFPNVESISIVCPRLCNIQAIDFKWLNLSAEEDVFMDEHLDLICSHFHLIKKIKMKEKEQLLITNEGFHSIGKLTQLEEFDSPRNGTITNISFLKNAQQLKKLDLSHCSSLPESAFDFCSDESKNINNNNTGSLVPRRKEEKKRVAASLSALREVAIPSCNHFTTSSRGLRFLHEQAPNLVSLLCSHVTGDGYETIATKMTNLRRVEFSFIGASLTKQSLQCLVNNLIFLEDLSLNRGDRFDAECFLALSQSCAPLKNLIISNFSSGATDEGFRHLSSLQHLEKLTIRSLGYDSSRGELFTGDIGENNFFSKTLKHVSIQFMKSFSDEGLQSITKDLSLESLELIGSPRLTSEGVEKALLMMKSCGDAKNHEDDDADDESFLLHQKQRPSLKSLAIEMREGSVRDLRFLRLLPSLRCLRLPSFLDFKAMREKPDELGFGVLPSSLEDLYVTAGNALGFRGDEDIAMFSTSSAVANLKRLTLVHFDNLSDGCLVRFLSQMKNLEHFDFRSEFYAKFTDDLVVLAETLPRLKTCSVGQRFAHTIKKDNVLNRKIGHLIEE